MTEKFNPQDKAILVIDDDESICAYLKALFELEGFRIDFCGNGQDGLARAVKQKVDLIILDWMMPILSGFEVLKILQKDDRRDIPVIVITARVADESTVEMIRREINVAGFVPKPIKHAELLAQVHEILNTLPRQNKGPKAA